MLSLAIEQKEPHVYELKLRYGYQSNDGETLLAVVTADPVTTEWSWKTTHDVFAVWLHVKAMPGMRIIPVHSREDLQKVGQLFLDYLSELGRLLGLAKQWPL